jgi:hypothetical protein
LLDAIAPGWKTGMMARNQTIQDALAGATGLDDPQRAAFGAAVARIDTVAAGRESAARVVRLVALRKRQVDSLLAAPGILLELSASAMPGKDFNACGLDPQNHLQVSPSIQIQTRWWRPCAGSSFTGEFNVPSVHDGDAGTVRAVIGPLEDVKLTIDGAPVAMSEAQKIDNAAKVRLDAPRANVQAARANVSFDGRILRIVGLPQM